MTPVLRQAFPQSYTNFLFSRCTSKALAATAASALAAGKIRTVTQLTNSSKQTRTQDLPFTAYTLPPSSPKSAPQPPLPTFPLSRTSTITSAQEQQHQQEGRGVDRSFRETLANPGTTAIARRMEGSFYMRELPTNADLIPYDSVKGKQIFRHALEEGGLEAFFPLSQQFLTQEEPAYCGIGTLCMVLNALKVDPAKTWRKPWRWFTQEMLDCCRPLEYIRKNGITLMEFTCLARCNGLEANTKYADKVTLEDFRRDIIASTTSSSQIMAVSYSRSALGQTGSGHFSPVGGYSSLDGGKVLILDVARFKYPSYWVSVRALYESLIPVDPASKQPRGYSILRKPPREVADRTQLLKVGFTKTTWPEFFGGLRAVVERLIWEEGRGDGEEVTVKALTEEIGRYVEEIRKDGYSPISIRQQAGQLVPNGTDSIVPASVTTPAVIDSNTSAAYDPQKTFASTVEYSYALQEFFEHLANTSRLHALLVSHTLFEPASKTTTNPRESLLTTVLLLALYSFPPFLRRLSPQLKTDVENFVAMDLGDEETSREVAGVHLQMESLETCCREECGEGCSGGVEGCTGRSGSGKGIEMK